MKKLILSFTLSFIIMGVEAQKDSVYFTDVKNGVRYLMKNNVIYIDTNYKAVPVYDTIKVDMLVNNKEIGRATYHMEGYSVREVRYEQDNYREEGNYTLELRYKNFYYHQFYLDKDKRKLSPSIIVWMSK